MPSPVQPLASFLYLCLYEIEYSKFDIIIELTLYSGKITTP